VSESFGAFFKSLFSAQGRSSRGRFWLVLFVVWITLAVAGLTVGMLGKSFTALLSLLLLPVFVGALVAGVINAVKRLHDLGRSGWWLLLVFVLYAVVGAIAAVASMGGAGGQAFGALLQFVFGAIYLIVFGAIPGQRQPNKFGDPPRQAQTTEPQEQPA